MRSADHPTARPAHVGGLRARRAIDVAIRVQ